MTRAKSWNGESRGSSGYVAVHLPSPSAADRLGTWYGLRADTSSGEYGELLIQDPQTLTEIRDALTETINRLGEPDITDGICRELARLDRSYARVMNDPDALTAQLTLAGRITGLRMALCILKGWDPQEDAGTEGKADDYFREWLYDNHLDDGIDGEANPND